MLCPSYLDFAFDEVGRTVRRTIVAVSNSTSRAKQLPGALAFMARRRERQLSPMKNFAARAMRAFLALATVFLLVEAACAESAVAPSHATGSCVLAMVGQPGLPADFDHFPYAEPNAPRGGKLHLGVLGTFENLNRFNIKFLRAPLFLQGAVYESLMTRSGGRGEDLLRPDREKRRDRRRP